MTQRKIVTSHVYPPIPILRSCDWCAHYEGEEEKGGYGWGATEAEAIAAFLESQDEEEGDDEDGRPEGYYHSALEPPEEPPYDDGQPDEQQEWHDYDPDC